MLASLYLSAKTGLAMSKGYAQRRVRKHAARHKAAAGKAAEITASLTPKLATAPVNTTAAFEPPYSRKMSRKQARREELARRENQRRAATVGVSLAQGGDLMARSVGMAELGTAGKIIAAETEKIDAWTNRADRLAKIGDTLSSLRKRLGYVAGAFDSTLLAGFALHYNGIDITPMLKVCWGSIARGLAL